jgi:hypothetical protein
MAILDKNLLTGSEIHSCPKIKNTPPELYIASMGSPSGRSIYIVRTRAALGTCGQVARIRTVLLTVRPVVAASVLTQTGPVWTIGLHSRPDSKRVPSGRQ